MSSEDNERDEHSKDDVKGKLILNVGQCAEVNSYIKVSLGNNPEDVENLKAQLKEESGVEATTGSIWMFIGEGDHLASATENLGEAYKVAAGGAWFDVSNKISVLKSDSLAANPMKGELFLQYRMESEKTLEGAKGFEPFLNSMRMSISFDGSYRFFRHFGKYLVQEKGLPLHEKFVLKIVQKFHSFDMKLDLETFDTLPDELKGSIDTEADLQSWMKDIDENVINAMGEGFRIFQFITDQMYLNYEVKLPGINARQAKE